MRSVAAVLTIAGLLDDTNVDLVAEHVARFVGLGGPVIVDAHVLEVRSDASLDRLVSILDAECHLHGVEWVFVTGPMGQDRHDPTNANVLLADSLNEALQYFVWAIYGRRNLRLAM